MKGECTPTPVFWGKECKLASRSSFDSNPQAPGALPNLFQCRFKSSQLFRVRIGKDLSNFGGVFAKNRRDQFFTFWSERYDPDAPILRTFDPAYQASIQEAVDGHTDRAGRKKHFGADRIHRQRPFVQKGFKDPEIGVVDSSLFKSRIEIFRSRLKCLHQYQPTVNRVSRVLGHDETIVPFYITDVQKDVSISIYLASLDTSESRPNLVCAVVRKRIQKQKEEVHGNEFGRNFQRCGGNKHLAGSGCRFGTVFLRADFPVCCPQSLHQANHRLFGFSRRALGLDRGSAFWRGGHRRRPQHFAGLPRKTWRLAHRAVPDSGHVDVAQVLDRNRSHDGADTNDSVHEERLHARRRPADFSVRCRTVQSGCPTLALNAPKRRQPQCAINLNNRTLLPSKRRSHRRLSTSYFTKRGRTSRGFPNPCQ